MLLFKILNKRIKTESAAGFQIMKASLFIEEEEELDPVQRRSLPRVSSEVPSPRLVLPGAPGRSSGMKRFIIILLLLLKTSYLCFDSDPGLCSRRSPSGPVHLQPPLSAPRCSSPPSLSVPGSSGGHRPLLVPAVEGSGPRLLPAAASGFRTSHQDSGGPSAGRSSPCHRVCGSGEGWFWSES